MNNPYEKTSFRRSVNTLERSYNGKSPLDYAIDATVWVVVNGVCLPFKVVGWVANMVIVKDESGKTRRVNPSKITKVEKPK